MAPDRDGKMRVSDTVMRIYTFFSVHSCSPMLPFFEGENSSHDEGLCCALSFKSASLFSAEVLINCQLWRFWVTQRHTASMGWVKKRRGTLTISRMEFCAIGWFPGHAYTGTDTERSCDRVRATRRQGKNTHNNLTKGSRHSGSDAYNDSLLLFFPVKGRRSHLNYLFMRIYVTVCHERVLDLLITSWSVGRYFFTSLRSTNFIQKIPHYYPVNLFGFIVINQHLFIMI